MAFVPFTPPQAKVLQVSVSYRTTARGRKPLLRVSLTPDFGAKAGWQKGDRFGLMIGEGDDAGKLRIVPMPEGYAVLAAAGRQGSPLINFGHVPELGAGLRVRTPCEAELVAPGTVEIILPEDWSAPDAADEDDEDEEDEDEEAAAPAQSVGAAARASGGAQQVEKDGITVTLDPDDEGIAYRGRFMETTPKVARLLAYLVPATPHAIGRAWLCAKLWPDAKTENADAMLSQLAKQAAPAARAVGLKVETIRGVGIALREAE